MCDGSAVVAAAPAAAMEAVTAAAAATTTIASSVYDRQSVHEKIVICNFAFNGKSHSVGNKKRWRK